MPFSCKIGDSFYLPDDNGRHRWVIITKPNSDGNIVIVNFTDADNVGCSIIFRPGEHNPFTLRTTIFCGKATLVLESKVKPLRVKDYFFFSERQVERIVKHLIGCSHTLPDILAELETQYPNY